MHRGRDNSELRTENKSEYAGGTYFLESKTGDINYGIKQICVNKRHLLPEEHRGRNKLRMM
jgi:hypothetical protein